MGEEGSGRIKRRREGKILDEGGKDEQRRGGEGVNRRGEKWIREKEEDRRVRMKRKMESGRVNREGEKRGEGCVGGGGVQFWSRDCREARQCGGYQLFTNKGGGPSPHPAPYSWVRSRRDGR